MSGRDEKVIFAFAPAHSQPDNIPVMTFLMPEAAWSYMQKGLCHEFDLTNVGLPIRVLIGRTKTHQTGLKLLEDMNGGSLKSFKELWDADVHFGQKPKQ